MDRHACSGLASALGVPGSRRRVCIAAAVAPGLFLAVATALERLAGGGTGSLWPHWWMLELGALLLGILIGMPTALIMRRLNLTRAWHAVVVVALICVLPQLAGALESLAQSVFEPPVPARDDGTTGNGYVIHAYQLPPLERWIIAPLLFANSGLLVWWMAFRKSAASSSAGLREPRRRWPARLYWFFAVLVCTLPVVVLLDQLLLAVNLGRFGRIWSLRFALEAWLQR